MLFKLLNGDASNWDCFLPAVQYGLNCRISSRHRSLPFALFFGRAANALKDFRGVPSDPLPDDELLKRARLMIEIVYPSIAKVTQSYNSKVKSYHDKTRKMVPTFAIGSTVMRKNLEKRRKSDSRWVGPYAVRRVDGLGSYTLTDSTGADYPSKVAQKHLKFVATSPDEPHYEISEILDHRGAGSNREYLVSWEGYSQEDNSWVPINNFDSLELIKEYHEAVLPRSVGSATRKRAQKIRK